MPSIAGAFPVLSSSPSYDDYVHLIDAFISTDAGLSPSAQSANETLYCMQPPDENKDKEFPMPNVNVVELLYPNGGEWGGEAAMQSVLAILSGGVSHLARHAPEMSYAAVVQELVNFLLLTPPPMVEKSVAELMKRTKKEEELQDSRRGFLVWPSALTPSLVLLLFHSHAVVHQWTLQVLLEMIGQMATESLSGETIEEVRLLRWRRLWQLGVQLLCIIKYIATTSPPLVVSEGSSLHDSKKSHKTYISDDRTVVLTRAVCGLLTVLTAVDQRLTTATAELGPGVADIKTHPIVILLLGGATLFQWYFRLSQDAARAYRSSHVAANPNKNNNYCSKPWEQKDSHKGKVVSSEITDAVSRQVLSKLANVLNTEMGKLPHTTRVNVERAIAKIGVHVLLDNAKGIPKDHIEEGWRWGRMYQWWYLLSLLNPPPPPPGCLAAPMKAAGWLIRILLLNIKNQFNFTTAAVEAKLRGTVFSADLEEKSVLDVAVYAVHSVFQTLGLALPKLLFSRYVHQLLEAEEKDYVGLAIGGTLVRQSTHAVSLLNLFLKMDIVCFQPGADGNNTDPIKPFLRVWQHYPTIVKQAVKLGVHASIVVGLFENSGALVFVTDLCPAWLLTVEVLEDCPTPLSKVLATFLNAMCQMIQEYKEDILRGLLASSRQHTSGVISFHSDNVEEEALSRLLSSGSNLPRIIHILHLSPARPLQRLAELMSHLFLQGLSDSVRTSYECEAGEWLWRCVILPQNELQQHFLALDSPVVDNLARAQGKRWLTYMTLCKLNSMRPNLLAVLWWMTALLLNVVELTSVEGFQLLDRIVTQLPNITYIPGKDRSEGEAEDTNKALTYANCIGENASVNLLQTETLYRIAKQVFILLLQKSQNFPQQSLVSAVLRVAGALPMECVQQDRQLQALATQHLVRLLHQLQITHQETIKRYAPPWLLAAIESASKTIDEHIAEQNKRFEQFEWEEKRLAQELEADKVQQRKDEEERTVNEARRQKELEKERAEAKPYVSTIPIPQPTDSVTGISRKGRTPSTRIAPMTPRCRRWRPLQR
ncbi:hypothetical protein AGDE_14488 [Angomonas deanei]|uniref:Uncharacterized protein n=1 Tax=Angomonas deanei TaxID=59799 RepID=A0A7G2CLZ7_9TRYP|nr:hypothetical protein AGDE_14488 [Angomonas deanei]CAD2220449.1 hypothetical protein, conserved [Angomonas deanei]|eukprot:EPY20764.1 hypothetical protein AGDE_14488 [Angomonas deanei]